jgi:hypothetical protein
MSGTKRTPTSRRRSPAISPRAVELFEAMRELECECEPIDWGGEYWNRETCAGCERWRELHGLLNRELRLRPWQFPAIEHPDAENPYPPGSPAAASWKPDLEAQARWRALEAALGTRTRAEWRP